MDFRLANWFDRIWLLGACHISGIFHSRDLCTHNFPKELTATAWPSNLIYFTQQVYWDINSKTYAVHLSFLGHIYIQLSCHFRAEQD